MLPAAARPHARQATPLHKPTLPRDTETSVKLRTPVMLMDLHTLWPGHTPLQTSSRAGVPVRVAASERVTPEHRAVGLGHSPV